MYFYSLSSKMCVYGASIQPPQPSLLDAYVLFQSHLKPLIKYTIILMRKNHCVKPSLDNFNDT